VPRTTESPARFVALLVLCVGALVACHREGPQPGPPADAFDVRVDAPAQKGKPFPAAPDAASTPWKVWINQEEPRQKKAPVWQHYDAKASTLLDLAADGTWRCALGAVHVVGHTSEHGAMATWTASRKIRCSTDGFRTYVESLVRAEYAPDGALTGLDPPGALYLNEVVKGEKRFTAVVLKKDGKPVARPTDD
jgi:predicted small lipoprotein YifL